MSFTFLRKMPDYHYQGNDAYLKLSNDDTDAFVAGTLEQISITITPVDVAVGDTITIKATGGNIVFTCVAALTGAAGEFLPPSSFGTDVLFLQALVVVMNAHYQLHQLFVASLFSFTIDLFSIAFGNFTVTPYCSTTGTAYSTSATPGNATTVVSSFRHRLEIWRREATNELTKLGEELRLPLLNGASAETIYNIVDYLGRLHTGYFKWTAGTEVLNRSNVITEHTIFAGGTVSNIGESQTFKVLPGKLRNEDFERFYLATTDASVSTDWDGDVWNEFLTNCPDHKKISPTGFEKLYFLAKLRDCEVKVRMYAANGSTLLYTYNADTFVDLEFVEICLDIADVLSNYTTPADVWFLRVNIHGAAGGDLSRDYWFDIDRNYYQNNRTVIFKNQRGGFDVLLCHGDAEVGDAFERTEITPMLSVGNPNTLIKRGVYNAMQKSVTNLSTGWIRKADMLWLADLVLSDEIYLVDETTSTILHHAVITTTEQGRNRDRVHQYAMNFSLQMLEG